MNPRWMPLTVVLCLSWLVLGTQSARGDEIYFEDTFQKGLSDKWEIVGLKPEDYRIKNSGLEVRVQPGKLTSKTPHFKVKLPVPVRETVAVAVHVTVLDPFTAEGELAGVQLLEGDRTVFSVHKQLQAGRLIYTPAEVEFIGKAGEEGDLKKYKTIVVKESPEAGPLRIVVDNDYAFFQVGPSAKGKYHNHFYSAINWDAKQGGFALVAAGAPKDSNHWVRFENFRVYKR